MKRAPEPPNFKQEVRYPGKKFLAKTPNPTAAEWARHAYWRRANRDLRQAYGSICAYSATWIPFTDGHSVEHFVAKSKRANLAYEWRNYRLVFGYLNGCKGTYEDVLDPFTIKGNLFAIHFPSLLVVPRDGLSKKMADKVRATARRLHLNDENRCLGDRREYLRNYCLKSVSFDFLERKTPFLAAEIRRQGLVTRIADIMRFTTAEP